MRSTSNTLRMALATLLLSSSLPCTFGQEAKPNGDPKPPAATESESAKPGEPKKDEPVVPPPPGNGLVPNHPAFFMNVAVNKATGNYYEGERLSVHFKSERDAHVYLLYHQADGSAVMIFPNKAQTSNLVKAKEEVSIPKAGDNFLFRVAAPFGEEALQVVASVDPIESLDKLDSSAGRAVAVPPAVISELAKAIKSSPGKFAEHRAVIHTHKGAGPLPVARKPARFGFFFGASILRDESVGKQDPILGRNAEHMHKLFTTLGGVPAEHARLKIGEEATRAVFQESITQWLPSVSQPGDTIVIFYTGHGGQADAKDDSEADGKDEYVTTVNFDRKNLDETVILDDVLARWLQELPGRQIALIMETCHGGGFVDGTGLSQMMRDDAKRCHDISQLNTALITGCLPEEYTIFFPSEEITIMPRLIGEAMTKLPRPVSIEKAFEYYRERLPAMIGRRRGMPDYAQVPALTNFSPLPIYLVPADGGTPDGNQAPQ